MSTQSTDLGSAPDGAEPAGEAVLKRTRKAKIVATLGPASAERRTIMALCEAGVDVFRLNFSHGSQDDHERAVAFIRSVEEQLGRPIGILLDLQGPKLRLGTFQDGAVELLKRDKEPGADMLRAEIFWKGGDWVNASKALRRVVKANGAKKGKALSEEQAAHVLNYAISMTLSGNERGLGRLRRDYGRALEATSMKDAFRLVTAPTALGLIDPASVMARVKIAENFKTFLGEYKKQLKEKGLSSLTEQTADAGAAANTEGQPAQGG